MSTVGEADRRVGECGAQADEWHVNRLLARYEYDPYGRMTSQAGFYAAANPFRWSTKRFDPETGSPQRISPQAELSDFGMRYYSATLGRWLNRDPIGDFAGANVYAYVGNNPTNFTDYLGLASASCRPGEPCHSGLSSGGGGGGDPWSPEPTTVEEGDRRPCPHAGRGRPGDDGRIIDMIMPITPEQLIALVEAHNRLLERHRLLRLLVGYRERLFGDEDLLLLYMEALRAIREDDARFREIFQQFVAAWYRAHRAWLRNRVFPRVEVKRHIRGPVGWVDTAHNVLLVGSFGMVGAVVGDATMDATLVPVWGPPDKEVRGDWFFCTRRVIGICISLVEAHFDDFEEQE